MAPNVSEIGKKAYIPQDYNFKILNYYTRKPAIQGKKEDYRFSLDAAGNPVITGTNCPLIISTINPDKPVKVTLKDMNKKTFFFGSEETDRIRVKNSHDVFINGAPPRNGLQKFISSLSSRADYADIVELENSDNNYVYMPDGGSVYFNNGSEGNFVTGAKNKVTYFKGDDKKENLFVKEK